MESSTNFIIYNKWIWESQQPYPPYCTLVVHFPLTNLLHTKYLPTTNTHTSASPIIEGAANSIITSLNQQTPSGKVPVFGHNLPSFSATFHPVIRVRGARAGRSGPGFICAKRSEAALHKAQAWPTKCQSLADNSQFLVLFSSPNR